MTACESCIGKTYLKNAHEVVVEDMYNYPIACNLTSGVRSVRLQPGFLPVGTSVLKSSKNDRLREDFF